MVVYGQWRSETAWGEEKEEWCEGAAELIETKKKLAVLNHCGDDPLFHTLGKA